MTVRFLVSTFVPSKFNKISSRHASDFASEPAGAKSVAMKPVRWIPNEQFPLKVHGLDLYHVSEVVRKKLHNSIHSGSKCCRMVGKQLSMIRTKSILIEQCFDFIGPLEVGLALKYALEIHET